MKILTIQLYSIMSGVQKVSLNEFKYFQHEYENILICKESGEFSQRAEEYSVSVEYVPSLQRPLNIFRDLLAAMQIIRLLQKYKPDVVHTHSAKPGILGRVTANICKINKIVHTCHGLPWNDKTSFLSKSFYKMIEKFATRCCTDIIALNQADYDYYQSIIRPNTKVHLIPNGLDESEIYDLSTDLPAEKNDILILSRLDPQKAPHKTIKKALEIKNNLQLGVIHVIGNGVLFDELFKQYNSNPDVIFHGWLNGDQKNQIIRKCRVMCSFSDYEGYPMSILEALSAKNLIYCSKIPAHIAMKKVFGDSICFDSEDIKSSYGSIEELFQKNVDLLGNKVGQERKRNIYER